MTERIVTGVVAGVCTAQVYCCPHLIRIKAVLAGKESTLVLHNHEGI